MSAWFHQGLPFTEGKDSHGRDCKMVDPAEADDWRAVNLSLKTMGNGQIRGLVEEPLRSPQPTPPPTRRDTPRAQTTKPPPVDTPPAGDDAVAGERLPTPAERIQESKAVEAEGAAKMRRLALQRAEGALVERAGALRLQRAFVAAIAAALDRMPADQATVVAAELETTEHKAFTVLRAVADRLREDLATHADAAADAAGGKPVLLPG